MTFICFIRGGTANPKQQQQRKKDWQSWINNLDQDTLLDNGILTTDGKIVANNGKDIRTFHFSLSKNASAYLILEANSLDEAVTVMQDCPVFKDGGNVTIRPIVEKYNS